jgi:hypothetical protein
LEALERITTPVIDRAMLETLLHVRRRVAIRLMHRFGGYQAGKTFLIGRDDLLGKLRQIAAGEPYYFETRRRERLGSQLAEVGRDLAQRRIASRWRRTWCTASSTACPPRSAWPTAGWRSPAATRTTCYASSWNSPRRLRTILRGSRPRGDHGKLTALLHSGRLPFYAAESFSVFGLLVVDRNGKTLVNPWR